MSTAIQKYSEKDKLGVIVAQQVEIYFIQKIYVDHSSLRFFKLGFKKQLLPDKMPKFGGGGQWAILISFMQKIKPYIILISKKAYIKQKMHSFPKHTPLCRISPHF